MIKSTFKFSIFIVFFLGLICAFTYQSQIQTLWPTFRADVLLSGMIIIIGWLAGFVMRSVLIGVMTTVVAAIVPTFSKWVVIYWPY